MAGMMNLADRVLHVPSSVHGVALCGEVMRDPWACGPLRDLAARAVEPCVECWAKAQQHGV